MHAFDPDRVGRLGCDAWVAYCRRRLPAFLRAAVGLNGPGAAGQRALAMLQSDRLVAEGCDPASPLVPMEREALIRSYTALCAALAR